MPCMIQKWRGDELYSVEYEAASLAEAAEYEPEKGVYTVASTFEQTKTLKLNAHLDRLEDSARREGIPLNYNRTALRQSLRHMIETADFGSVRFRITVPADTPDEWILSIEPFTPPSVALREQGVRCITSAQAARSNPRAKTTDWMKDRIALKDAMPVGIVDTFLLDDEGNLLEGLGSNFYAILDDELRTADEDILHGISRQIVLEVAPPILPVRLEAVNIHDLLQLQETFLTSSSRGIIPVVEIDSIRIGTGSRGAYTQQLQNVYGQWVQAHLEEL